MTTLVVRIKCTNCEESADAPLGTGTALHTICDCGDDAHWMPEQLHVNGVAVVAWGDVNDDIKELRAADLLKAVEAYLEGRTVPTK